MTINNLTDYFEKYGNKSEIVIPLIIDKKKQVYYPATAFHRVKGSDKPLLILEIDSDDSEPLGAMFEGGNESDADRIAVSIEEGET